MSKRRDAANARIVSTSPWLNPSGATRMVMVLSERNAARRLDGSPTRSTAATAAAQTRISSLGGVWTHRVTTRIPPRARPRR